MVDNIEAGIEDLNLDNDDFKETLTDFEGEKNDMIDRILTLEKRE